MSEAIYKNHAIRDTIKKIRDLRTDTEILRLPTPLLMKSSGNMIAFLTSYDHRGNLDYEAHGV